MELFKSPNFNFLRWRWITLGISAAVIAAGLWMIATTGVPRNVEFEGGMNLVVRFTEPVTEDQIRTAIPGDDEQVQTYGDRANNEMLLRVPLVEAEDPGASLAATAERVTTALQGGGLPSFEVTSRAGVSPVIGAELQRRGISATVLSILAITIYIAFRFRLSFAFGSIIATFHDVLVTLSFLVFFNYEMSLNIIAAMLTMVGYSVNDMIVIFDRVRENSRLQRRVPLDVMINTSLNQTLTRTVITSGTVLLAVLALYLFGGEVLEGFAFTMLVGTLATTYSGWFIAPSLAIMLSGKSTSGARTAPGRTPTAVYAPPQQPTRKSKPARKARAS
jgi:preprotein translocase subunit SecF